MRVRAHLVIAAVALVGCGRVDFAPLEDAVADVAPDQASDAMVPGLVVAYPADELVGGVAPATVAGYDGSCTTCPTLITGVHGNAYAFDGAACIHLPAISTSLVGVAPYTVSAWVHSRGDAVDRAVVAKAYAPAANTNVFALEIFAPGSHPTFETTSTGADFVYLDGESTIDLRTGWHHVATRWDGQVKSVIVDSVVTSTPATAVDAEQALVLGCDRDADVDTHYFIGDLDDLRFYDRALSDAELAIVAGG